MMLSDCHPIYRNNVVSSYPKSLEKMKRQKNLAENRVKKNLSLHFMNIYFPELYGCKYIEIIMQEKIDKDKT